MSQQMTPQGSDLPSHARERLNIMRGDAKHRPLFTSDLSVNEFLLVCEAGFDPVGLVVGSSIYHIGYQQARWNQNQEMVVLTQAMYHARELAMTRMEEEANELRADGIVGLSPSARPFAPIAANPIAMLVVYPLPRTSPGRISGPYCAPGTVL